jgi:Cof subfamily protein (haloacid dehalogenase superfamily)
VKYRLVVADLDGTARSRTLGVTCGVRAAVAAAQARGVRVCVATGRMWRSAERWVRCLGAQPPAILYNGGQVYDFETGRVLSDRRLSADATRRTLGLVRGDPTVQPHLFVNDRVYVERAHPLTDAYLMDDGLTCEVVASFEPWIEAEPHKLLVIGGPARVETLAGIIRAHRIPVHAVQSEPTYLEILPAGTSKGAALCVLLDALSVDVREVVAVGDNWNDLEMIEAAGLGVAMGHAPEGVRARADHVCGTAEEEGLRQVIERFVLER